MRNYKAQLFVAAFATIIALPMPVLAHSGGTDSSGCHTKGEYRKVWGNHAAIPISDEDFSAGCHCSNLVRSVPSSTRARVCSMRCAPRFDQRIC